MKINKYDIGQSYPPFIIAEMSGNHNHSLEQAIRIVEAAAASGVQALKIQTYRPETMTIDVAVDGFIVNSETKLWAGRTLFDLYKEAHTPWEWHSAIFKRARDLGLVPFSTPFDATAVDFLESLNVECYKVASFEITDLPLIKRIGSTKKPLILSTGMATLDEIGDAVEIFRSAGGVDLVLLKCTSSYPASPSETNLLTIPALRKYFKCEVGLSDHTMGIGVSIASIAIGATVIEKHFTLNRSEGGVDSVFSMEPSEMRQLVSESLNAWLAIGCESYGPTDSERASLQFRRSIYVVDDVKSGDILTSDNVRIIRPGHGLPPKFFDEIIGKRFNKDFSKGTPLTFEMLMNDK